MPTTSCQRSPAPRPTSSPSRNDPVTLIRIGRPGERRRHAVPDQPVDHEPGRRPEPARDGDQQGRHRGRRPGAEHAGQGRGQPDHDGREHVDQRESDAAVAQEAVGLDGERAVGGEAAEEARAEQQPGPAPVTDVRSARRQPLQQHTERERAGEVDGERADRETVATCPSRSSTPYRASDPTAPPTATRAMNAGVRCTGIGVPSVRLVDLEVGIVGERTASNGGWSVARVGHACAPAGFEPGT